MTNKLSFAEFMAEDRRLVILRSLDEAMEYNLNEQVLKTALHHLGHNVGADIVRAELTYLKDHGLVRVEVIQARSGELWIVTLSERGQMVARGQYHPGVARPSAS
jgi:predicted transcriptional regulator